MQNYLKLKEQIEFLFGFKTLAGIYIAGLFARSYLFNY